MKYEFYDDDQCATLNQELTDKYGTLDPVRDYKHYDETCQVADNWSYKFTCDADKLH